jgi:hypothetical protein
MSDSPKIRALILCPDCKTEMRLFGIEPESEIREVYTFECNDCGRLEVRGVLVGLPYSAQQQWPE